MVNAFGYEAKYEVVKQRMLEEFSHRQSLGNNKTNDFFAARKRSEKSWKCFAIRLEALAVKVASAVEGSRQVMVRSRFFSALPAAIGRQVELQLGHLEDVTLEQMLRVVAVVETQRGKELERVAVGSEMAVQGGVGARPRVGECSHCHKRLLPKK